MKILGVVKITTAVKMWDLNRRMNETSSAWAFMNEILICHFVLRDSHQNKCFFINHAIRILGGLAFILRSCRRRRRRLLFIVLPIFCFGTRKNISLKKSQSNILFITNWMMYLCGKLFFARLDKKLVLLPQICISATITPQDRLQNWIL